VKAPGSMPGLHYMRHAALSGGRWAAGWHGQKPGGRPSTSGEQSSAVCAQACVCLAGMHGFSQSASHSIRRAVTCAARPPHGRHARGLGRHHVADLKGGGQRGCGRGVCTSSRSRGHESGSQASHAADAAVQYDVSSTAMAQEVHEEGIHVWLTASMRLLMRSRRCFSTVEWLMGCTAAWLSSGCPKPPTEGRSAAAAAAAWAAAAAADGSDPSGDARPPPT
jgi:hypothetical protein